MKNISGYGGRYGVTIDGQVYSHLRKRFLAQSSIRGYLCAHLSKDGVGKCLYIHRLVAEAYIPNKYGKREVNHIDGNKHNNHINNLEWATRSENMQHAFDNGLKTALRGSKCGTAKLTEISVAQIRNKRTQGKTLQQLAHEFGVSIAAIGYVINRQTWTHVHEIH